MSYFDFDALHIEDRRMSDVRQLSLQLAATQASLLIVGDAGTTGAAGIIRAAAVRGRAANLVAVAAD